MSVVDNSFLVSKAAEYRRRAQHIDQPEVAAKLIAMAQLFEARLAKLTGDRSLETTMARRSTTPRRQFTRGEQA